MIDLDSSRIAAKFLNELAPGQMLFQPLGDSVGLSVLLESHRKGARLISTVFHLAGPEAFGIEEIIGQEHRRVLALALSREDIVFTFAPGSIKKGETFARAGSIEVFRDETSILVGKTAGRVDSGERLGVSLKNFGYASAKLEPDFSVDQWSAGFRNLSGRWQELFSSSGELPQPIGRSQS